MAKEKYGEEVRSFYVTLPFAYQIVLVDLVRKTVYEPIKPTRNIPGIRKNLRPSYLAAVNEHQLLVTTEYRIFGVNLQTGMVELYTNQDYILDGDPVNGEFGYAQVAQPGPPIAIPGYGGMFIVADWLHNTIRVIDMNQRRIFSLCKSRSLQAAPTTADSLTAADIDLPFCDFDNPYAVMFTDKISSQMIIAHGYQISYYELLGERT